MKWTGWSAELTMWEKWVIEGLKANRQERHFSTINIDDEQCCVMHHYCISLRTSSRAHFYTCCGQQMLRTCCLGDQGCMRLHSQSNWLSICCGCLVFCGHFYRYGFKFYFLVNLLIFSILPITIFCHLKFSKMIYIPGGVSLWLYCIIVLSILESQCPFTQKLMEDTFFFIF